MSDERRLFDAASLKAYVDAEIGALLPKDAQGGVLVYVGLDGRPRFTWVHRVGDAWRLQGALEFDLRQGWRPTQGGLSVLRTW